MIQNVKFSAQWTLFCSLVVTILLFFLIASCGNDTSKKTRVSDTNSGISSIDNMEQLNKIIETSGECLLMFDFYADWCPPCKELEPILDKIAKEKSVMVKVYKINIDRNSGLYPKNMYLKAVERFSAATEP